MYFSINGTKHSMSDAYGFTSTTAMLFIANCGLKIVCRKQLVISHVIPFYPHKSGIMIRFGITVPFLPADFYMVRVCFQMLQISL